MTLTEELQTWKTNLEAKGLERSKAEGRLEQAMAALNELGFSSVAEAEARLIILLMEKKQAEEEAATLISVFEGKYVDD